MGYTATQTTAITINLAENLYHFYLSTYNPLMTTIANSFDSDISCYYHHLPIITMFVSLLLMQLLFIIYFTFVIVIQDHLCYSSTTSVVANS